VHFSADPNTSVFTMIIYRLEDVTTLFIVN